MIHSTSNVHPTAVLGPGVVIGPKVVIGPGVYIGAYSCIGGLPEQKAFYDDYDMSLVKGVTIHERAKIFEFVTIHSGTDRPTFIGERAAIFNHAHIAHDCLIFKGVLVGGHASLAGHCTVLQGANLSGRCNVHQRTIIGAYSFLGASAYLTRDLPPGEKWMGIPARPAGTNTIGLERQGLTFEQCRQYHETEWNEARRGK